LKNYDQKLARKPETIWRELVLDSVVPHQSLGQTASIKIKLEVDTMPPPNFDTEEKLLLQPFSFYVKCFSIAVTKLHPSAPPPPHFSNPVYYLPSQNLQLVKLFPDPVG
jgi:hypothetical protein